MRDLDLLTIGAVTEMFIESQNDMYSHPALAARMILTGGSHKYFFFLFYDTYAIINFDEVNFH